MDANILYKWYKYYYYYYYTVYTCTVCCCWSTVPSVTILRVQTRLLLYFNQLSKLETSSRLPLVVKFTESLILNV